MRFPSAEWAAAFRTALNASAAYQEAAAAWEGDLLLRVLPEDGAAPAPSVALDLYHGTCREARFEPDGRHVDSEFVFEGSVASWRRLFAGTVDPVQGLMDGTFRLRGNVAKAMRFTRAARELVATAAAVPVTDVDG